MTLNKENEQKSLESKNGKIIVFESNVLIMMTLCRYLKAHGYEPVTTRSRNEVVAQAQCQRFEAVIMDIDSADGIGAGKAMIELLKIGSGVKVVALSSMSAIYAEKMMKFGFKGIITKPYTLNDMNNVMDKVLA